VPINADIFRMTKSNLDTGERRQKNRRDSAMSTIARKALKLRRGLGLPAAKSFLLRRLRSLTLVEAILAIPKERRIRRRR
jgi:hypothetical protein